MAQFVTAAHNRFTAALLFARELLVFLDSGSRRVVDEAFDALMPRNETP
jgi:hypothetical protein